MAEAYIVDALRTSTGKRRGRVYGYGGYLSGLGEEPNQPSPA